jgi:hypothetical protein
MTPSFKDLSRKSFSDFISFLPCLCAVFRRASPAIPSTPAWVLGISRCMAGPYFSSTWNHPKRSRNGDAIFLQTLDQKQISFLRFSFAVSQSYFPTSLSVATLLRLHSYLLPYNLGTTSKLNTSSSLSLAFQIPRSRCFKTRAQITCKCHVTVSKC